LCEDREIFHYGKNFEDEVEVECVCFEIESCWSVIVVNLMSLEIGTEQISASSYTFSTASKGRIFIRLTMTAFE